MLTRGRRPGPRSASCATRTNLGFTATVNRGLRATRGDVVVLNSDTEVGPRWLERLRAAAYREPATGTATAGMRQRRRLLAAGHRRGQRRPAAPRRRRRRARWSPRRVGDALAPTPTANGFCMYLRRAMLDDVGLLDEAAFPRGYGEENDLCLRASRRGWSARRRPRDLRPPRARGELRRREGRAWPRPAARVLDERFPEYTAGRARVRRRPGHGARRASGSPRRFAATGRPAAAGALRHPRGRRRHAGRQLRADARARGSRRLPAAHVRPPRACASTASPAASASPIGAWELDAPDRASSTSPARTTARSSSGSCASTRSTSCTCATCSSTPSTSRSSPRASGIPVVFSFHDFYFTCPTVHLLDDTGPLLRGALHAGRRRLPRPAGGPGRAAAPQARVRAPVARGGRRAMLAGVDAFVTTSEHVRDGPPRRAAGDRRPARSRSIPHGRALAQRHGLDRAPAARRRRCGSSSSPTSSATRAGVPARDQAPRRRPPGAALPRRRRRSATPTSASSTAATPRRSCRDRVAAIAPAVVGLFSIVAETFSHALTEAWALGVPVVATDLGAFGERLRAHEGGWLIPPDDAAEAARRILADRRRPARPTACRRGGPTCAACRPPPRWPTATLALYAETLDRRRSRRAGGRCAPGRLSRGTLRLTAIVGGADGVYPGSTYVRVVQPLRHPSVARRDHHAHPLRRRRPDPRRRRGGPRSSARRSRPTSCSTVPRRHRRARGLPLILDLDDHLLLKRATTSTTAPHHTRDPRAARGRARS